MNCVSIRAYEDDDWLAAASIHDQARPIELSGSCDKKAFIPLEADTDDLEIFVASAKYVACKNGQIVGFVGVKGAEITWLYVKPSEFGQGIGRLLLQYVLKLASGEVTTYVLEGNRTAENLYLSEGFCVERRYRSKNNGYACTVLKLVR